MYLSQIGRFNIGIFPKVFYFSTKYHTCFFKKLKNIQHTQRGYLSKLSVSKQMGISTGYVIHSTCIRVSFLRVKMIKATSQ